MTRTFIFISIALAGIAVSGCKKVNEGPLAKTSADGKIDEFIPHKVKELKDCQVLQIINKPSCCSVKDTLVFSYNSWGDPTSITRLPRPTTGAPNYIFQYDKKRRLTDIIGTYEGGTSGEFWHKYFYANPGNSEIVMDSTYYFVTIKNGEIASNYGYSVTYYTYDKMGRIIKDSIIVSPGSSTYINNYVYDANGNLAGRVYDDKVNIHRTNNIWMFYDRDYSVNNPFPAPNYNSSGLPVQFSFTFNQSYYLNFLTFFKDAQITYSCN